MNRLNEWNPDLEATDIFLIHSANDWIAMEKIKMYKHILNSNIDKDDYYGSSEKMNWVVAHWQYIFIRILKSNKTYWVWILW